MTASELIEQLETLPPDCMVVMPNEKTEMNDQVSGILVIDNDDDRAVIATILGVEDSDITFP